MVCFCRFLPHVAHSLFLWLDCEIIFFGILLVCFFEAWIYTWEDLHFLLPRQCLGSLPAYLRPFQLNEHLGAFQDTTNRNCSLTCVRASCGYKFSEVLFPSPLRAEKEKETFPYHLSVGLPPAHTAFHWVPVFQSLQSEFMALASPAWKRTHAPGYLIRFRPFLYFGLWGFYFVHYISFHFFHYKLSHIFKEIIYIFCFFRYSVLRGSYVIWCATLLIVKLLHYSSHFSSCLKFLNNNY